MLLVIVLVTKRFVIIVIILLIVDVQLVIEAAIAKRVVLFVIVNVILKGVGVATMFVILIKQVVPFVMQPATVNNVQPVIPVTLRNNVNLVIIPAMEILVIVTQPAMVILHAQVVILLVTVI